MTNTDFRRYTEESMYHDLWEEFTKENNPWIAARGSAKSNRQYIVDQILNVDGIGYYSDQKPNKKQKIKSKSLELPESYPKGDLEMLFE